MVTHAGERYYAGARSLPETYVHASGLIRLGKIAMAATFVAAEVFGPASVMLMCSDTTLVICCSWERGAVDLLNGVWHGGCGCAYTPDLEGPGVVDLSIWYNTCRILP